jgi:hypothetical protein
MEAGTPFAKEARMISRHESLTPTVVANSSGCKSTDADLCISRSRQTRQDLRFSAHSCFVSGRDDFFLLFSSQTPPTKKALLNRQSRAPSMLRLFSRRAQIEIIMNLWLGVWYCGFILSSIGTGKSQSRSQILSLRYAS